MKINVPSDIIMDCTNKDHKETREHLQAELQIQEELGLCPLPDWLVRGGLPFAKFAKTMLIEKK